MEIYRTEPIIISGPSGAGKDALISYITSQNVNFLEANGCTTRAPRATDNGQMKFITREEFEALIQKNLLIEYTIYAGNYYGVAKSEFEKLGSCNLIFNVGYTSAKVIKGIYNGSLMIYLLPPNKEELKRRLGDRDPSNKRYELGMKETLNNAINYNYILVSETDDLTSTFANFMDIVTERETSEQMRLVKAHNRDFISKFYK